MLILTCIKDSFHVVLICFFLAILHDYSWINGAYNYMPIMYLVAWGNYLSAFPYRKHDIVYSLLQYMYICIKNSTMHDHVYTCRLWRRMLKGMCQWWRVWNKRPRDLSELTTLIQPTSKPDRLNIIIMQQIHTTKTHVFHVLPLWVGNISKGQL